MTPPVVLRRARTLVIWSVALAGTTAAMLAVRERLDKAHITLVLLLLVLLASARGGRLVGLWLAGTAFLVFNWFFLPPYGTFVIADPLDWLVLVAFLLTSIVAAELFHRAQEEARAARERTAELDRLWTLGADTLSVARAEDALGAVAEVICTATGVATVEVFLHGDGRSTTGNVVRAGKVGPHAVSAGPDSLIEWVAEHGTAALERSDGTVRLATPRPATEEIARVGGDVRALLLPLSVRERTVGVLRLSAPGGVMLDAEKWRFLDVLTYYTALGVERARLAAAAERAEVLREADRLKDAMLAAVSHDLRTPLTTIKALARDLRALGDTRAEIIEQEADRLNRTVQDLLDVSRLNAGALPVHVEVNAVDDLLGALTQRMESTPAGARLRLTLSPAEPLLLGRFDLVHSLRILANLVENAAKYAPPDTPIDVTAARDGTEIVVMVSDRGPGIAAADVERIFDPFYRPARPAPDVGGTGLGLSIARRLAELQGGRVTYAPRSGAGSTFSLHLPAEDIEIAARSL